MHNTRLTVIVHLTRIQKHSMQSERPDLLYVRIISHILHIQLERRPEVLEPFIDPK
jgi:hypothetical protein